MATLESLAKELVAALQPLRTAFSDEESFKRFIYNLGWNTDSLPATYSDLADKVTAAVDAVEALSATPGVSEVQQVFVKIKAVYDASRAITDVPSGVADPATFLSELAERLFEYLLVQYLKASQPTVFTIARMVGVIEQVQVKSVSGRPSFIHTQVKWDQIPAILLDPGSLPERIYGWGTDDPDYGLIADHLMSLFAALNFRPVLAKPNEAFSEGYCGVLESGDHDNPQIRFEIRLPYLYLLIGEKVQPIGISILDLPATDTALPGIIVQPLVPSEVSTTIAISDTLSLAIRANSNISSLFGILIRPEEISIRYPFSDETALPEAGFGITLDYHPTDAVILLGNTNETRIELKGASLALEVDYQSSGLEVIVEAMLKELAVIITPGQGDGFIQNILGTSEQRINIPLGIRWSSISGISFTGSGGFEIELHPHLAIGPISIDAVQLRLKGETSPRPAVTIESGVSISGVLGPLQFVVQGIGLQVVATFDGGNSGPFGVDLGFLPPTGIGLSINAQGFTGGGFLFFDNEKGEYSGGLELEFKDLIALRAIGILNTKMPDGSSGFSLLLIITADFTPIQLGYGFTLNGVGGLIGINRTCITTVLQSGVKDGSLKSILFPENIVANAARIISDLQRVFPIQEGQHLFGPMAKIGWGTPTLVTIEMGLIIEIPDPVRIAILGVLKTLLPDENFKLLSLQVNFLGLIDFEKGAISFDASLFDSKLLTFALTGDMALRLSWGENPVFVLSAGGFHPSYTPPAGLALGEMQRLGFSLFPGNNPRLRVETYFAVTSNTAQFGANGQLYISKAGFKIEGYIGFDVLFQFSPFYFIAEIKASLSVSFSGEDILSLRLSLSLDGPSPWHAKGSASFKILFVKIKVSINKTFGDESNTALEPVDVLPKLISALKEKNNWTVAFPSNSNLMVTLAEIQPAEGEIIAHPFGTLSVSQKVVPLDMTIQKFGSQPLSGDSEFSISEVNMGGSPAALSTVKEEFAPAQYFTMTDAEKLSHKDFEKYKSGASISGVNDARTDYMVHKEVEYEVKYLRKARPLIFLKLPLALFTSFLNGNALANSPLSGKKKNQRAGAKKGITINTEQFVIANTSNLQPYAPDYYFDSEREALLKMEEIKRASPSLSKKIQVVPSYEVNA